ncbi:MAG: hypothetical protein SFX72_06060 [Isosphaeraceae bacterium]|nr:hypothetical protein [Isosphaeraceae bacterium]
MNAFDDAVASTTASALDPKIRVHLARLAGEGDRIEDRHRATALELGRWIAENHSPGRALGVIIVCTGNSRRSILGSTMGNLAAAFHGIPEVRFHSGGTAPSAFNPRTIAALRAIGVEIEATGTEAPRGDEGTPNPIHRVRWGGQGGPLEMLEFSKRFDDPANPRTGFAAVMVCNEADAGCPFVPGAGLRLSMPYADPKEHDDTAEEAERYAERRDDIGRAMLVALAEARARIDRSAD